MCFCCSRRSHEHKHRNDVSIKAPCLLKAIKSIVTTTPESPVFGLYGIVYTSVDSVESGSAPCTPETGLCLFVRCVVAAAVVLNAV